MKIRDIFLATLVAVLWGLNFIAAKLATAEIPPMVTVVLRFIMVAALLLPFVERPRGRMLRILALGCVLGTIHFSLIFYGVHGTDAATASIISQLQVPFSSILAALFFRDRLGWRRLSGMAVAFVGVIVVCGGPRFEGHPSAIVMLIGASLAFALANIVIKWIGDIDGFALNAWMCILAIPQLVVLSCLFESHQITAIASASPVAWLAVAYTAVMSTIAAYGLWYFLLHRYDVNQVVPFVLLIPVTSVVAGVAFLGEALTWQLVIGGLLTIVGIAVIILRRPSTVNERVSSPT